MATQALATSRDFLRFVTRTTFDVQDRFLDHEYSAVSLLIRVLHSQASQRWPVVGVEDGALLPASPPQSSCRSLCPPKPKPCVLCLFFPRWLPLLLFTASLHVSWIVQNNLSALMAMLSQTRDMTACALMDELLVLFGPLLDKKNM